MDRELWIVRRDELAVSPALALSPSGEGCNWVATNVLAEFAAGAADKGAGQEFDGK